LTRRTPHIRTKQLRDRSRISGPGRGLNAHRLIAETAVEMAQELFEVYAHENDFYRKMRANGQVSEKQARLVFVERVAPRLLEDARQQLTTMLGMGDDVVSPRLKEEIYEALIKDNELRAKRFVAADQATVPGHLH
jgi:hypothetical protein